MKDRTPKYPGRVKLVPVDGQDNVFDMTRADEATEGGTPYDKLTILTDETAALFGLSDEAVPDDMFRAIRDKFDDVDQEFEDREQTFTVAVPVSWAADATNGGYYQTVAVAGILASDNPVPDVVLGADVAANDAYLDAWGSVTRITTANGSVTLYANKKAPTSAFTMQLKVVR